MKGLMACVQSNLDQISKISRILGNSTGGNEHDMICRLYDEETLRTAAEASNTSLRDQIASHLAQIADLKQQVQVLLVEQDEAKALARRRDADYRTLENELAATAEKLRTEEAERLLLVDQMRKKEVEVLKSKEAVDRLTAELQRLGDAREELYAQHDAAQARIRLPCH